MKNPWKTSIDRISDFWFRYSRNKAAVFGLAIVIIFALIAVMAPIIVPYDPNEMYLDVFPVGPNVKFPFGIDHLGRDTLSRVIWGTRISLFVGFVSAGISAVVGTILGAISGYYGGFYDDIIMRIVDIFLMIPTFFLVLLVIAVYGSSIWNIMIVIGLTIWPSTCRLVRGQFLAFKEQPFVEAERALGSSSFRIIFKSILPNAFPPAIVNLSLQIASAILTESSLSFLGLGDPNQISWGMMLKDAQRFIRVGWWMAPFPGLAIGLTVLSFNLIGDGINDALNPRLRER